MARLPQPVSVEITLPDGKVLHFQTSLGDVITLSKIDTKRKGPFDESPSEPVKYYTLLITPCEGTKG